MRRGLISTSTETCKVLQTTIFPLWFIQKNILFIYKSWAIVCRTNLDDKSLVESTIGHQGKQSLLLKRNYTLLPLLLFTQCAVGLTVYCTIKDTG